MPRVSEERLKRIEKLSLVGKADAADLIADLREAREDTARLDWMEKAAKSDRIGIESDTDAGGYDVIVIGECGWFEEFDAKADGLTLRNAIDAARKETT